MFDGCRYWLSLRNTRYQEHIIEEECAEPYMMKGLSCDKSQAQRDSVIERQRYLNVSRRLTDLGLWRLQVADICPVPVGACGDHEI